jgi:DNA-binding response OmpR family regulator
MSDEIANQTNILLVEDEENLALGLEYNLSEEGYEVKVARDGREAIKLFDENDFDLIVLDIMLPYYNGFEIAKHIRENHPQMPILMLTARTQIEDRVKGLELGADDYLTKPFHLKDCLE